MFERRGDLLHVPAAVGHTPETIADGSEWIAPEHPDRPAWEAYLAEEDRLDRAAGAPDGAQHTDPAAFPTSHQTGLAKTEGDDSDPA